MYAYCENNPVIATDENGKWIHLLIGALVGAAVGAISAAIEGKSGAEIAIAAGAGALTGLLTSTGLGPVAQVVGGAAISAGESIISQGVTKGFDNIDYSDVASSAISGGIAGGVAGGVSHGVSKHLFNMGASATNRVCHAFVRDGIKAGINEIAKAGSYYISQTATVFYKPLITGAIKAIGKKVVSGFVKSNTIWAS